QRRRTTPRAYSIAFGAWGRHGPAALAVVASPRGARCRRGDRGPHAGGCVADRGRGGRGGGSRDDPTDRGLGRALVADPPQRGRGGLREARRGVVGRSGCRDLRDGARGGSCRHSRSVAGRALTTSPPCAG